MERSLTIAIDGPAGAGKTTVGRRVAGALGYRFLDTGAMYRAITLLSLREHISPDDEDRLLRLVQMHDIDILPSLSNDSAGYRVLVDGEDVSEQLRSPAVGETVSAVSRCPKVRQALVDRQRRIAERGQCVLVGRDIGTVVLPDAQVKVFLTASLEARTDRRFRELRAADKGISEETVRAELLARDQLDSSRAASPLRAAPDARVLDTTALSVEDTVTRVLSWVEKAKAI
ncbi:MAG: (d)CMP kinase [Chloroflexi bacterium]|nr:(d)CMP kinase [Chloroflexota bacterium]